MNEVLNSIVALLEIRLKMHDDECERLQALMEEDDCDDRQVSEDYEFTAGRYLECEQILEKVRSMLTSM